MYQNLISWDTIKLVLSEIFNQFYNSRQWVVNVQKGNEYQKLPTSKKNSNQFGNRITFEIPIYFSIQNLKQVQILLPEQK